LLINQLTGAGMDVLLTLLSDTSTPVLIPQRSQNAQIPDNASFTDGYAIGLPMTTTVKSTDCKNSVEISLVAENIIGYSVPEMVDSKRTST